MKLGALTTLQKEDIWYTEPRDLPENIVAELEPLWNREVERARRAGVAPSLFRAAANYMSWHWLTGSFLRCTADMMDFVRPIIMQQILLVMEGNADQAWGWVTQDNVWMLGVLMFCSAMVSLPVPVLSMPVPVLTRAHPCPCSPSDLDLQQRSFQLPDAGQVLPAAGGDDRPALQEVAHPQPGRESHVHLGKDHQPHGQRRGQDDVK